MDGRARMEVPGCTGLHFASSLATRPIYSTANSVKIMTDVSRTFSENKDNVDKFKGFTWNLCKFPAFLRFQANLPRKPVETKESWRFTTYWR